MLVLNDEILLILVDIYYTTEKHENSVVLCSIYLRTSFYMCPFFLLMLWNLLQNNSNYIESFIFKSSSWSPLCIHPLRYMTWSVYWNVIGFIQLDIRMPVAVYLQFTYFCAITVLWLTGPWPHIQNKSEFYQVFCPKNIRVRKYLVFDLLFSGRFWWYCQI